MDGSTPKPFRFSVYMTDAVSRGDLVDKCRRAEAAGYDVIGVADHLGMWAPFPAVMLAAEVTERPRLATTLLNTSFYNPLLLAREVAAADQLTAGRLELGLGTGYMRSEFETAGLRWPTARRRVEHLDFTVRELRRLFDDPGHRPEPAQRQGPPIWLGGRGDRVLALAAREADVVAFTGFAPAKDGNKGDLADGDGLAERVKYVRGMLGDRDSRVELNVLVWRVFVTKDRRGLAGSMAPARSLSAQQLLDTPTVLMGTPRQMAEQIVEHRETYGFSHLTVRDCNLDDFAPVIDLLR